MCCVACRHLLHASELEYLDLLVHNTQLFSIKTAFAADNTTTLPSSSAPSPLLDLLGLPPLLISVSLRLPTTSQLILTVVTSEGHHGTNTRTTICLSCLLNLLTWTVAQVQAFTVDLQGEACSSWLSRLLQAPVRSAKDPQHMGLGQLFPSVSCNTLFLPATSRQHLNNLAGASAAHGRTASRKRRSVFHLTCTRPAVDIPSLQGLAWRYGRQTRR